MKTVLAVLQIFLECRTLRKDWTGDKSVKAHFPIKEHLVNAFLRGEYAMDAELQALVDKCKKTQAKVNSTISSQAKFSIGFLRSSFGRVCGHAQRLTYWLTNILVMRVFYNHTAFQLLGDPHVRISLDTELTMVREDN